MKEDEEKGGTRKKGLEKKGARGKVQGRSNRHERYKKQEQGKKGTKE
jgi:hypothetical protein